MLTYGLPAQLLKQLTGVHIDTARRWKRRGRIPRHFQKLVQLGITGDLGTLHPAWNGFRLVKDQIWTPEDEPVRFGELRAIPLTRALVQELRRQLAEPQQLKLL